MNIDRFTRDAAYFQSRRDSGMLLNAEDLDFQFNNLIDYLNNKIVPIINNFTDKEFIGVANPALENACLLNIGDGNTTWKKIDSNIFPDYSITKTKFTPVTAFSIIATTSNSNWAPVATRLNDSILFSRNTKSPLWRKVATGDIANKTLTSDHIDLNSVRIEHLNTSLRRVLFAAPRMILDTNVNIAYVRGENLQDNSLVASKFAKNIIKARQSSIDRNNYTWLDNSIENRHIADQVLIGGYGILGVQSSQGAKYTCLQTRYSGINTDDNVNYTFTSANIINESITEPMIGPTPGWGFYTRMLTPESFKTGAVQSRHIKNGSVSLKVSTPTITGSLAIKRSAIKIPKEALDPVIRAKLGV
jgi:hypothetical protein